MSTKIMTMPYEIDPNEAEVEIEFDYEPLDPGDAWCPPSGDCVEIAETMHVVVKKGYTWVRTGETRNFSDLPEDVQESWQEDARADGSEEVAEARMMRKARRYRHMRGFEDEYC